MKMHRNCSHSGQRPAHLEASPGQDRLEEWEGEVACDPSFWAPGLDRIGVVSALILAKQPDV